MKYDIKKLTLDEKIELLVGVDTWHTSSLNGKLRQIRMSDGPNGLRKEGDDGKIVSSTSMPTLSVVANTWNKELAYLDGQTIADDCVENDVDVLLAPGVNIKRTPLNGRNFEYFSEDPVLAGTLAKEYILGVQDKGVGTSLKHYCLNNREIDRIAISNECDERTLNEIYLKPFEIAIEANPWTVMCSYNPVNGVYMADNKEMLNDVLRDKLGFKGMVVSDWGAVKNGYKSVKANLSLRMPFIDFGVDEIKKGYEDGKITEQEIDEAVNYILELIEKVENSKKEISFTKDERHNNAVKIAEEGIVLLKNDGVLPLNKNKKYFINGDDSKSPIITGGGSAACKTDYKFKRLDLMLNEEGFNATSDQIIIRDDFVDYITCGHSSFKKAYESDGVILVINAPINAEAHDLESIKLYKRIEKVITETCKYNENVIVLLFAGSAIDMSGWIDKVKGVLLVGYAGEGVNEAIVNILTGKTNPSGKLSETFPLSLSDTPTGEDVDNLMVDRYKEGIFVGYRYYDMLKKDVLFPFGFGLSYSNFSYSDLEVKKLSETDYEVSYNITNNSDYDGKEVSEIYVKDVMASLSRPEKELKAFSKDLIKAHQTKRVTVKLDKKAFTYYLTAKHTWFLEEGYFEILVGGSSRCNFLKAKIYITPEEYDFSTHTVVKNGFWLYNL